MGLTSLGVGITLALVAICGVAMGPRRRCPVLAVAAIGAFLSYGLWPFDAFLVLGSTAAALAWFWMASDALRPGAP
jgi:hypothetical protein